MKNIITKNMLLIIALLLIFTSCNESDNGVSVDLNRPVNIKSFSVDNSEGKINNSKATITITLPFGTDLSKVVPEIKIPSEATIHPTSGTPVNLIKPFTYRVINGNVYKDYTVYAKNAPAILIFKVSGTLAKIDEKTRTIKAIVPSGTDITSLPVEIKLASGASITPPSGSVIDFTNPVTFTVVTNIATVEYKVIVIEKNAIKPVAFLNIAPTKNEIKNPDEKAAAGWFFNTYPKGEYISFSDIKNGNVILSKYSVIWWHEDATQTLPATATNPAVLSSMIAYHKNGGGLLLTTFSARWLEPLEIVPPGKGPNNVFGSNPPNQTQDVNNWSITFKGHENHPLFQGLNVKADDSSSAPLLSKNAFRLNHVSWWKVNGWGGYGNAAGWRKATGGIDLAGPGNRNGNISIAEFPKKDGSGNTVVITPGSYDWYAEPNPKTDEPSPPNKFLSNIKKLTKNAIDYLRK